MQFQLKFRRFVVEGSGLSNRLFDRDFDTDESE